MKKWFYALKKSGEKSGYFLEWEKKMIIWEVEKKWFSPQSK